MSALGRLCAHRLGLERPLAERLLSRAQAALGPRRFRVRAVAFTFALTPAARVVPRRWRRRALVAFAAPLLDPPAVRNAYGAGREWLLDDAARGLER